jgi:hypothetical protein
MDILKLENLKELLPTDNQQKKNTKEMSYKNRGKTGFNFNVSSYSVYSVVSIIIRTIKHIPKDSNILVNKLRVCVHSTVAKTSLMLT